MRVILTSDTHMGRKNNDKFEIKQTYDFFKWTVDIAKEKNILNLVHLGDFFHNRKTLSIPTMSISIDMVTKLLSKWFEGVFLLLGNHDCYYRNAVYPSSLDLFKFYNNRFPIRVINKPRKINNTLFIPWMFPEDEIKKIVDNEYDARYAMGHLPINEIVLNRSGRKSDKELFDISDFNNYDVVFSGHFHQPGEYNNIIYIGAPYHMNFNDSGPRGIYIFDDETGDIEFIEYHGAPKYQIMDAENYDEDLIKGNIIRLEFHNNLSFNKIDEIINAVETLNPYKLNISYKYSKEFTNENESDIIDEIKGNKETLIDYIKKSGVPPHLNLSTIIAVISSMEKEILTEASEN